MGVGAESDGGAGRLCCQARWGQREGSKAAKAHVPSFTESSGLWLAGSLCTRLQREEPQGGALSFWHSGPPGTP